MKLYSDCYLLFFVPEKNAEKIWDSLLKIAKDVPPDRDWET